MRWSRLAALIPAAALAAAHSQANYSLYSNYAPDALAPPRPKPGDECFNCLLPKFTCGQYAECSQYDGQCKCPDGWGGMDCLMPQCGSLKDGHNRPLRKEGENCDCPEGWSGLNCNVCKNDAACSGFPIRNKDGALLPLRAPDGSIRGMSPPHTLDEGEDHPNMTCFRNGPTVINNHYMCDVTNPKIVDMLKEKTPQVTFSCDHASASCTFQFWIGTRESFYCGLDDCKSSLDVGTRVNTTRYDCEKLRCNCIPGRMLCGEANSVDISEFLTEEIKGPAKFQCKSGSAGCTFEEDAMNDLISTIFSDSWITLSCDGGECLHYSQVPGFVAPPEPPYYFGPLYISAGVAFIVFFLAVLLLWYFARPMNDGGVKLPSNDSLMTDHVPAALQFSELSYTLPQYQHRVLDSVSGSVQPGQLLAIMGASGAGKSTLLDILARRQKMGTVAGAVLVNGRSVPDGVFRRAAGYVDQEDTLMGTLTVYETVYYSALLRLPREMSASAKRFRTLQTLDELGILSIRDARIGDSASGHRGISGGEKRRVSIACELVTSPSILFLDEPTSGLDAYNALSVVECLHRLAREFKRTVIFTIHQPRSNIVSLFDRLVVLAKGQVVYSGEMARAQQYFADVGYPCPPGFNIADFLIDATMESDSDRETDARSVTSVVVDPRDTDGDSPGSPPPERNELHRLTGYIKSRTSNLFSRSVVSGGDPESASALPSGSATPRRALPRPLNPRVTALVSSYSGSDVARHVQAEITQAQNASAATANGALLGPGQDDAGVDDDGILRGRRRATWATQFRILSGRAFKNLYRDPALLATHYIAAIAIALLAGHFYYHVDTNIKGFQNRLGLFFFSMALFAFSCLSSLGVFSKERVLFMRERANGYYSTFTYFSSKVLFDIIPLRVVPPLVFGGIVYGLVGLVPTVAAFWKFLLVLVLFNLTAASVCLMLAIAFEDIGVANLVGTLVMLFNLLFAGLLVNRDSIAWWLRWLFTASFFHAAFEALAVNELRYLTVTDRQAGVSIEVPAATVLSMFGLRARWYWNDVSLLVGMFLGFTALSFVFLHYFVKERR